MHGSAERPVEAAFEDGQRALRGRPDTRFRVVDRPHHRPRVLPSPTAARTRRTATRTRGTSSWRRCRHGSAAASTCHRADTLAHISRTRHAGSPSAATTSAPPTRPRRRTASGRPRPGPSSPSRHRGGPAPHSRGPRVRRATRDGVNVGPRMPCGRQAGPRTTASAHPHPTRPRQPGRALRGSGEDVLPHGERLPTAHLRVRQRPAGERLRRPTCRTQPHGIRRISSRRGAGRGSPRRGRGRSVPAPSSRAHAPSRRGPRACRSPR